MISYCTNVHPAQDLPGVLDQLDRFAAPVRAELDVDVLGLGLWLAADVAAGLADDPAGVRRLRAELAARGLAVVTLNAFPYGGFHDDVVKHAVYRPRWTDPERLWFTRDAATVLSGLLPDGEAYGSVSTLPLGWREPWTPADDGAAGRALDELTGHLAGLDRPVRLAVEPEPGCVLDTVADAVDWLAGRVDPRWVGLCLDTCHLAVSFADPSGALRAIAAAGLDVVKVQASAALHAEHPADPATRAALAGFVEPRYLHQVRERAPDGSVRAADDLDAALRELPGDGPWRVHFHVPLHWDIDTADIDTADIDTADIDTADIDTAEPEPAAPLRPTTEVLHSVLSDMDGSDVDARVHVEVETYTWTVLPDGPRTDAELVAGIAAELRFAGSLMPAEAAL